MQPIPRYHLVATRGNTINTAVRHICAVDDPRADVWQICDDRTAVLATCYSLDNAQRIVADANRGAVTSVVDEAANAALIAAAPDLLKLAIALVQSWEATADGCTAVRHNDGTVIDVRNLIKKATNA